MDQDLAGAPVVEVSSLDSDFQTFAVSNQAQMKELIAYQRCSFGVDVAILVCLLVAIFASGMNQMRT